MGQIAAFAIGQFARQNRHAGAFALLNFLPRLLPALGRLDGQCRQLFAKLHMLVQPKVQAGTHKTRHQTHGIAGVQTLLDLPLKLGVQHFGRQHIAGPSEHIFGQQLHPFGQQRMDFNKVFDGIEQAVAQATFMRAACAGGNQVDIALAYGGALFSKSDAPSGALTFCKVIALCIGKAFTFKDRNHQLAVQRLHQVVVQTAFVNPGLNLFGFFIGQRDRNPWHQHRFAAQ